MTLTDLVSNEDAEKEVELVEVDLPGTVSVEHIKHVVNLLRLQIGHVMNHVVKLNICACVRQLTEQLRLWILEERSRNGSDLIEVFKKGYLNCERR